MLICVVFNPRCSQTLHRRRLAEKDRAAALAKDVSDLRERVESSGERLARMEQVEAVLTRVHEKIKNDPGAVSAEHILKVSWIPF